MVYAYIDGVIVITKQDFVDHLEAIEKVLQKILESGLKVNAEKSLFVCTN